MWARSDPMPNQLSVPFKRTYAIPLREAVREYISSHYTDTHPDAYRWDIAQWEKLRAGIISGVVHVDRVNVFLRYACTSVLVVCELLTF